MNHIIKFDNTKLKLSSDNAHLASFDNFFEITNLLKDADSENGRRFHESGWKDFVKWCKLTGTIVNGAIEPVVIVSYLKDLEKQGKKLATIQARRAALAKYHQKQELEDTTKHQLVKDLMKAITKRINKERERRKSPKAPLLAADIRRMIAVLDENSPTGARAKAMILLGFMGALRRSELVNIRIDDIEFVKEGIKLTIPESKTGERIVAIPYAEKVHFCPIHAIKHWLTFRENPSGFLFCSLNRGGMPTGKKLDGVDYWRIVKQTAEKAGLDASSIGGHSTRSGFATQAMINNARVDRAMDQGGWKSYMTFKGYVREANLFKNNAASCIEWD